MQTAEPIDLGHGIFLIDGFDLGLSQRTGIYVIAEEELTLIETGPSPSVPHIREGLAKLGYTTEQVKYIIVTHIHLDHGGGAGLFLQECPNAKVVVHPKGARHLTEPDRLVEGARAVYGEQFDKLFAPIVPIPPERLIVMQDGEPLDISPDRSLKIIDSPGHANHHLSIYDPRSEGMFTGDTVGVHYAQLQKEGILLFLPSTSPNQFDPEKMLLSLNRYRDYNLKRIYFGHYGMTEQVEECYRQVIQWLPVFVTLGEEVLAADLGHEELAQRLLGRVQEHLKQFHIAGDHEVMPILKLDLQVCSMGIVDYLQKKAKNGAESSRR